MKLSFIVPVFNEERYLKRCLDSILHQAKDFSFEIIVIDNGSTDRSASIAQSYSDVQYFLLDHVNVSAVRNFGAQHASGELLIFLDGDVVLSDSWRENFFANIEQCHGKWFGGSHCQEPQDEPCFPQGWYDHAIAHMQDTHMNSGYFVIPKKLFEQTGGFDATLETGEDYEYSKRLIEQGAYLAHWHNTTVWHYGFPKDVKNFMRREMWHGKGDTGSLQAVLQSKVAIASLLFFSFHLLLLIGIASCSPLVGISLVAIIGLCVFSSWVKFNDLPFAHMLRFGAVYYLYFWARCASFVARKS